MTDQPAQTISVWSQDWYQAAMERSRVAETAR